MHAAVKTLRNFWTVGTLYLALVFVAGEAGAFEAIPHRLMTRRAILEPTDLLKTIPEQLGIDVPPDLLREEIQDGAVFEDFEPDEFAVRNHFHEPVGNKGFLGGLDVPLAPKMFSSARWAQMAKGKNPTSWLAALDALEDALSRRTSEERQEALRGALRKLGHVVHLLQDSASPPHTRNGPHIFKEACAGSPLEALCGRMAWDHAYVNATRVLSREYTGVLPPPDLLSLTAPAESKRGLPSPISNLWDRDVYRNRTGCAVVTPAVAGLAELSSAHAFSENTLTPLSPTGNVSRPCPELGRAVCTVIEEGVLKGREVCAIPPAVPGFPEQRIFRSWDYSLQPTSWGSTSQLDPSSIERAADVLVPRAIGYSRQLIQYFLRGVAKLTVRGSVDSLSGIGPRSPEWSLTISTWLPVDIDGVVHVLYDRVGGERVRVSPPGGFRVAIPAQMKLTLTDGRIRELYEKGPLDGAIVVYFRGRAGNDSDVILSGIEICQNGEGRGGGGGSFLCNPCGNGVLNHYGCYDPGSAFCPPQYNSRRAEVCEPGDPHDGSVLIGELQCMETHGDSYPNTSCCAPRFCKDICGARGTAEQCRPFEPAGPACGDDVLDDNEECQSYFDCPNGYCPRCQCIPWGSCGERYDRCGTDSDGNVCFCHASQTTDELRCASEERETRSCRNDADCPPDFHGREYLCMHDQFGTTSFGVCRERCLYPWVPELSHE